ncbi:MAG: SAM-dependent methyltransferase [Rectinema sp.]|nr:SAM-dependent methyltransferase [Rectinema sp.]
MNINSSNLQKTTNNKSGTLYLLPAPLIPYSIENWEPSLLKRSIPHSQLAVMEKIDHFIVESEHNAQRLLSRILSLEHMARISVSLLNEHSTSEDLEMPLAKLNTGLNCGMLPDAGMPCIADPGAALVAEAHRRLIRVVPIGTDSSIILALAASGLNGQKFRFMGYLPVEPAKMESMLASEGRAALRDGEARIFIETPYRNERTREACVRILPKELTLVFAANLGSDSPLIHVMPVSHWREFPASLPEIPAVFCFGISARLDDIRKNTVAHSMKQLPRKK